jgi:hypothetical protein
MLHLRLIILSVGGDVPVDSESLLVTDFMNLKIKSAQFFGGAHRVGCAYVYRGECSYVYEYLCFKKKRVWSLFYRYFVYSNCVCRVLYKSREMRSKEVVLTRCNFLEF